MKLPIDSLSDEELALINKKYAWVTMTVDSKGRRLGRGEQVFEIPDFRVKFAVDHLGVKGKSVVEFGCLEGAHTVALAREASGVTAIDGRASNLERATLRTQLYGVKATFVQGDVESFVPPSADLYFHSGVLYHLKDPVSHLLRISKLAKELFLDTHYTKKAATSYKCQEDGESYPCAVYSEAPSGAKAGLQNTAMWLRLGDIVAILKRSYLGVKILRDEKERNGPRVSIVAKRGLF